MPHWTAWVWSWARRKLALRLLAVPYSELLGCHVDAVFSQSELAGDDVGETVGKFRLKGKLSFDTEQQVTRQNLAKWSELTKAASHAI